MNDRHDIDAHIDAALAKHVRAPRLDRQFDAAVWRRIEAAGRRVPDSAGQPVRSRSRAARWLLAGNLAGVLVAAVLVAYFGARLVGGITLEIQPQEVTEQPLSWLTPVAWGITAIALAFGLMFTSIGRWVRAQLS